MGLSQLCLHHQPYLIFHGVGFSLNTQVFKNSYSYYFGFRDASFSFIAYSQNVVVAVCVGGDGDGLFVQGMGRMVIDSESGDPMVFQFNLVWVFYKIGDPGLGTIWGNEMDLDIDSTLERPTEAKESLGT